MSHFRFRALSAFLLIALVFPHAVAKPRYSIEGNSGLRFGYHANGSGPSTERFDFEFTQKAKYNRNWSGIFTGRFFAEGVYQHFPDRYSEQVAHEDSFEARLMDFYLQYKTERFMTRIGQQSVVWSETFGLPSADIVNPKDFREGGLGSMRSMRLPVAMINSQLFLRSWTLQGLFIPQPHFHLNPLPGSDFSLPYESVIAAPEIQINRERSLPLNLQNAETGFRVGKRIGTFDLGAFYFDGYDRNPYYVMNPASNPLQKMEFDERHSRIKTVGGTASFEISSVVYRIEALKNSDRLKTTLSGGTLQTVQTDEYVGVVGMDFPTWQRINFGFRWSESLLQAKADYLDRPRQQSLISTHLHRSLFSNHDLQLIYSYALSDGGHRASLNYSVPLSDSIESNAGVDYLFGPSGSEFGRIHEGSRIYISFRHFFSR